MPGTALHLLFLILLICKGDEVEPADSVSSGIWDEDPVCGHPLGTHLLAGDYNPFAGGFFLAVPCDKVGIRGGVRPACVNRPVGNLRGSGRLPGTLVHGPDYQRAYKHCACQNGSRYPVIIGVAATAVTSPVRSIVPSRMSE